MIVFSRVIDVLHACFWVCTAHIYAMVAAWVEGDRACAVIMYDLATGTMLYVLCTIVYVR